MSRGYWGWRDFPPSTPIRTKGGIKAQNKRGAFCESWWAKRWIAVLESFDIGARLQRGRSYARRGQVLDIDIQEGRVTASVQGSRPTPYRVSLEIKTLTKPEWKKVADRLKREAVFAAKLLAGEMPQDIEAVFQEAGVTLFPKKREDLKTECSCPDWANPCKHIAAVYYLMGEEFDRDPFLIFKLRGLDREGLLRLIDGLGGGKAKTRKEAPGAEKKAPEAAGEPWPADLDLFWSGQPLPEGWPGEVKASPAPAALLRRLGNFPFWRGETALREVLEPVYAAAAQLGLEIFAGGGPNPDRGRNKD